MRHRKHKRKLGRTSSHRKAMLRNLVSSLVIHQKVRTTVAKAKEARRLADGVITLAKQGTLPARRQAFGILQDRTLVKKVFDEIAPNFKERSGGYTRILRVGPRQGDGAQMAILELVEPIVSVAKEGKAAKVRAKPPREKKELPKVKKAPEEARPAGPKPTGIKEAPEPEVPPTPPEARPERPKFLEGLRKHFRRRPSP